MYQTSDKIYTDAEREAFNARYKQQHYIRKPVWWTYVCSDCGAVVQNTETHDAFHLKVDVAARLAGRLAVIG